MIKKYYPFSTSVLAAVAMTVSSPPLLADDGTPASSTCDGCSIMTTIEAILQNIADNMTAIKNALVSSTDDAAQFYSEFTAAYSATDAFAQASDNLTKSQTETLMQQFQGGATESDNISNAYSGLSIAPVGIYSPLSAYSLLGTGIYTDPTTGATSPLYAYNSDQQKAADLYSRFLSGNAVPITAPATVSSTDDKKQANMYRTLAAVQSLNAYNLSTLYAERYPIQTPTSLATLFQSSYISSQALIEYIQQEKVSNSDWLKGIATASPLDLSRDTVYLLAGIFGAIYRMEKNQERLLATQTATNTLSLLSINTMNQMLNQSKQQMQSLQTDPGLPPQ